MNYKDCINSVVYVPDEYLSVLLHLFPNFSYAPIGTFPKKFITVHDIRSKLERQQLDFEFSDYIIISKAIFDFEITAQNLIDFTLQFRQEAFKSKKRTLSLDHNAPTFISELLDFLTLGELATDDESILEVFNAVGTRSFPTVYLKICSVVPTAKVNRSINTFLSRINSPSDSLFYRKARARIGKRVEANLLKALQDSNRISYSEDQLQLNFIKAHESLFDL